MGQTALNFILPLGLLLSFATPFSAVAAKRCEVVHAGASTTTSVPQVRGFLNPGAQVQADGHVQLHLTQRNSLTGHLVNAVARGVLQPALKTKRLDEVLARLQTKLKEGGEQSFFGKVLESFGITSRFNLKMLEEVPTEGPMIVTLNHPLSGLELVAVAEALAPVRKDVKIVATNFLESVPGFKDHAIFVNPMGGAEARAYNARQREKIVEHLQDGHVIVIAPAGAVSVKEKLSDEHAMDPVWKTGVADFLAQVPHAQVLPVFVNGGPSPTFHRMQRVHPFAGTSMIIREIGDLIGKSIDFAIGAPIKAVEHQKFTDRRDLMKYLRLRTYIMSEAVPKTETTAQPKRVRAEPIAEAIDPAIIKAEIEGLKVLHDLAPDNDAKGMKALIAHGRDIPNVLNEIGRLREVNFWEAGEGTGRARDLDKYDLDYNHLIVWDKKQNRIAGAYRVGFVDNILREKGPEGLYTGQFFGIAPLLPSKLAQMFEIGRSFVDKDYQGRSFALPTLFGGLAKILAFEGKYRGFFGAVSVSNEFTPVSKALILKWAARYAGDKDYGTVSVKTPPRFKTRLTEAELDYLVEKSPTIQELNQLIEAAEGRPGARTPQLIPIYVELGSRFLAFDQDMAFNTVDGLILSDIRELTHPVRVKYMGEEGARVFEQKWNLGE
ncbi:MAG: lysophospholipid acyltransferase family protein [Bdellovibrionaceae bacterium]|nr:lysophospholipid acyltransferase family protein [Pseudobdellovibrionaceae bacterium]